MAMNFIFSSKNCDFEFLAKKIVEVFPCENASTYYVPPIPKRLSRGQHKSITSGEKLVDKYRNKIEQYRVLTGCKVTDESPAAVSVDQNKTAAGVLLFRCIYPRSGISCYFYLLHI